MVLHKTNELVVELGFGDIIDISDIPDRMIHDGLKPKGQR